MDKATVVVSVRIKITDMATVVRFLHNQNQMIETKGKVVSEVFRIFAESLPEFEVVSNIDAVKILTKLGCENGREKSNRLSGRLRRYLQIEQDAEQTQPALVQMAKQIMEQTSVSKASVLSDSPENDKDENDKIAEIPIVDPSIRTNRDDILSVPGDNIDFRKALTDISDDDKE